VAFWTHDRAVLEKAKTLAHEESLDENLLPLCEQLLPLLI
jgi:hypothetical protein